MTFGQFEKKLLKSKKFREIAAKSEPEYQAIRKLIKAKLKTKDKSHKLPKKSRVNLYIDGTNLFIGLVQMVNANKQPDFSSLLRSIVKLYGIDKIFFYASYMVPANYQKQGRKKLVGIEAKFYGQVKKFNNLVFYKGHRSPSSGKEKGVDVHLAADLIKDAFLDRYDQAVIMTGDSDLIYPVEIVRSFGLPIHSIFLPNRFSLEIAYKTDSAIVLNILDKFRPISRNLPKQLKIVKIKAPYVNIRGR